ncbi:Hypothetical protein SMAX5B_006284 [Scophthalmus maximus]|uniref:Uncharacterized protein n=1 Tax=Scophthalmus maximus TaxID=52904 RepID=A0A2U9BKC0_SCOMX|nr:Hypothetical protein SMAX5B_006284 [Scophthalmus maximus]
MGMDGDRGVEGGEEKEETVTAWGDGGGSEGTMGDVERRKRKRRREIVINCFEL